MGVDIEYTDGKGRKHKDIAAMFEADVQSVIDAHLESVRGAIEVERCEVHGESPSVAVSRNGEDVSFEITGCCDELVERAQEAAAAVK